MKKIIKSLLRKTFGKKSTQAFYELLFRLALKGMNYGNGGNFKDSGELNVLQYIKQKLGNEKSIVVFDVGGNVGEYAKVAARFFSNATIHAFEPSKKTFERFVHNTKSIENIIPNNFGLSDADTSVLLYSSAAASGLSSVYHRNIKHIGITMDNTEEISLSTIDNYCELQNIQQIHFLKLDIEGHELKALQGAARMLESSGIRFIQFEFGGTNIDSRTFFQDFYFLLQDKYRFYRVLKDGLAEIPNYKITQEIFVAINYLAEIKQ
jgi:FkbM family methyltransferase